MRPAAWLCALSAFVGLLGGAGAARAQGDTTSDNPEGGRVIAGALPAADSTTQAALVDMLRRAHAYFGARPEVNRVVVTPDRGSALAFFSATPASGPIWGVALASAGPGMSPFGALMYDVAGHLPQTLPALMKKAASLRPAPPAGADTAGADTAGAMPLTQQSFSDGSGEVGVPAGWQMASFREGRFVEGPPGQPIILGVGLRFAPIVPGSFMAQAIQRFPPPPGIHNLYIPFDPDPARALLALLGATARSNHTSDGNFTLLKVISEQRIGQFFNSSNWSLELLYRGAQERTMHYAGVVLIAPPARSGSWSIIETLHIAAPAEQFPTLRPTFIAIVRSIHLNQQVIQSEMQASNAAFQAFMKSNQEAFDANLARNEANIQRQSDASHAAAHAFTRTIRGVAVIAEPTTGYHYEAPDEVARALVEADPQNFHFVPLGEYIKGVDY